MEPDRTRPEIERELKDLAASLTRLGSILLPLPASERQCLAAQDSIFAFRQQVFVEYKRLVSGNHFWRNSDENEFVWPAYRELHLRFSSLSLNPKASHRWMEAILQSQASINVLIARVRDAPSRV
jgi:hypothetical protein